MRHPLGSTIAPVNPLDEILARKHGLVIRRLVRRTGWFDSVRRVGSPGEDVFDQIDVRDTICTFPSGVVLVVRSQLDGRDVVRVITIRYREVSIMRDPLASEASKQQLLGLCSFTVYRWDGNRCGTDSPMEAIMTRRGLSALAELISPESNLLATHAYAALHTGSTDEFSGLMHFEHDSLHGFRCGRVCLPQLSLVTLVGSAKYLVQLSFGKTATMGCDGALQAICTVE